MAGGTVRGRGRENPCRASGWGTGIEQGNEGTGTGQRDGATSVEQVDESKYDAGRWRDKCRAGDRATSVKPEVIIIPWSLSRGNVRMQKYLLPNSTFLS